MAEASAIFSKRGQYDPAQRPRAGEALPNYNKLSASHLTPSIQPKAPRRPALPHPRGSIRSSVARRKSPPAASRPALRRLYPLECGAS